MIKDTLMVRKWVQVTGHFKSTKMTSLASCRGPVCSQGMAQDYSRGMSSPSMDVSFDCLPIRGQSHDANVNQDFQTISLNSVCYPLSSVLLPTVCYPSVQLPSNLGMHYAYSPVVSMLTGSPQFLPTSLTLLWP